MAVSLTFLIDPNLAAGAALIAVIWAIGNWVSKVGRDTDETARLLKEIHERTTQESQHDNQANHSRR